MPMPILVAHFTKSEGLRQQEIAISAPFDGSGVIAYKLICGSYILAGIR